MTPLRSKHAGHPVIRVERVNHEKLNSDRVHYVAGGTYLGIIINKAVNGDTQLLVSSFVSSAVTLTVQLYTALRKVGACRVQWQDGNLAHKKLCSTNIETLTGTGIIWSNSGKIRRLNEIESSRSIVSVVVMVVMSVIVNYGYLMRTISQQCGRSGYQKVRNRKRECPEKPTTKSLHDGRFCGREVFLYAEKNDYSRQNFSFSQWVLL